MSDDEILFEQRGHAGLIVLNRPGALNALSHDMIRRFAERLAAWRDDDAVRHVVIRGHGRAFCAGGDIRAVYDQGRSGVVRRDFFADEFRLNAAIKHFPKPYVALVHGYVMGGGAGVSIHGSHRLFAEDAVFSMPETGIGYFPDIGSSFFLSRLKHEIGLYAALSAARLNRGDAIHTGLATHAVPFAAFDDIAARLADASDIDQAIAPFLVATTPETLGPVDPFIEETFSAGGLDQILARLDRAEGRHALFAEKAAASIRAKSPTSLRIALRQIRAAKALEFDDCIRLDYRIASEILNGFDFYEGVRAALVDKDRAPRWRPDRIGAVDARMIEGHFLAPATGDLPLP